MAPTTADLGVRRAGVARSALFARLATEADPDVGGQLAENIGRVRADSGEVAQVAERLVAYLPLRGAVRGLYFLSRSRSARGRISASVGERPQYVATTASIDDPAPLVRYRAFALADCPALVVERGE